MKRQPKFKDTEIGLIPEDWDVKRLGDCLGIVKKQFKPTKGDIRRYIGLEHIEQQSLKLICIGSSSDVGSNKFEFKKDQILFGKLRPYFRKVYHPNFDGVCSTDIWVIDTKEGNDNSFFFYFLADERIINEANNSSEGTRMPRARWDYLEKLEYPIPSLNEQHAIAKILSDLDSKIELLQKQNKTLEAIGHALFKHWFVDFDFPNEDGRPYKSSGGEMVFNEELGKEIPKGWAVKELKEIVSQLKPGTNYQPKRVKEGVPFVNVKNIVNGFLNLNDVKKITEEEYKRVHKAWIPEKHDILITRIGTLGNVGIIRKKDLPVAVHYNTIDIKAKMTSYQFIYFFLKSKEFQKMYHLKKKQSVQEYVTIEEVETIKVILPNNTKLLKNLEKEFISLLNKIELNANNIESLQKTRDSLLPKLMSGKIRVPVEVE
jgi:type I restriction enzyme S subunit